VEITKTEKGIGQSLQPWMANGSAKRSARFTLTFRLATAFAKSCILHDLLRPKQCFVRSRSLASRLSSPQKSPPLYLLEANHPNRSAASLETGTSILKSPL